MMIRGEASGGPTSLVLPAVRKDHFNQHRVWLIVRENAVEDSDCHNVMVLEIDGLSWPLE